MQHHVLTVLWHKTSQHGDKMMQLLLNCFSLFNQDHAAQTSCISYNKGIFVKKCSFFRSVPWWQCPNKNRGRNANNLLVLLLIPLDTVVSMHTDIVKSRHFYYVWALGVQSAGIKQAVWLCEQCAGCYPKRGFICTQWKKFAMTWPHRP